jgi:hypothetical protein
MNPPVRLDASAYVVCNGLSRCQIVGRGHASQVSPIGADLPANLAGITDEQLAWKASAAGLHAYLTVLA